VGAPALAWATAAMRTNHAAAAPQTRAARPTIRAAVAILVLEVLVIVPFSRAAPAAGWCVEKRL